MTYFFVPNVNEDDLAVEDEKFRAYLVANGWGEQMGEDDLKAFADAGVPEGMVEGTGEKAVGTVSVR